MGGGKVPIAQARIVHSTLVLRHWGPDYETFSASDDKLFSLCAAA